MSFIDIKFNLLKNSALDINEHFEILKEHGRKCEHITEMGVRSIISTWAFLAARPKKMISIDIIHPKDCDGNLDEVYKACREDGIDFTFIQASTLDTEIEDTDLLFIDTLHTYDQLSKELPLHGDKARKFIILHDTEHCADELIPAINEFLKVNNKWTRTVELMNNNGLTILERIA
jgi:hypothetical protein